MKVTTDACLFGAWVVKKIKELKLNEGEALDIGTGTGLLSLMLAQECNFKIDAIEINRDASTQAIENFQNSKWGDRIQLLNQSLQQFTPTKKYDVIFSNPPFYENDLKSPVSERNTAMHDDTLRIEEIFNFTQQHLLNTGHLFLLIPYKRLNETVNICNQFKMHLTSVMQVKQTEKHGNFRSFLQFSKKDTEEIKEAEMFIKNFNNTYSQVFINFLNLFYLHL